jgi:prepilin peptidase CpaA
MLAWRAGVICAQRQAIDSSGGSDGIPIMTALLPLLVVPLCVLTAISDFSARRVPNAWLLMALATGTVIFCLQWALDHNGPPGSPLTGFFTGLFVLLPFYAIRWMGAGDVKLFATLGFLLGAKALLPIWIIASLLAGAHVIYMVFSNYRRRHATQGMLDIDAIRELTAEKTRRGTPYAAFLSAGALITLFNPALMHWQG